MTKLNNIRDFYRVLDITLKLLFDSMDYSIDISVLKAEIKKYNLEFVDKGNSFFDEVFSVQHNSNKFEPFFDSLVIYLIENKFLIVDGFIIKLTFKGIVQSSVGFVNTLDLEKSASQRLHNVEEIQKFHLKWMTFLTATIALGTFVAMIYYFLEMISTSYCFCK